MSIQSDLETQLAALETKIAAAIAAAGPSWGVGQVRFEQNSYLKTLLEAKDQILKQLRSIPSEDVSNVQDGVSSLGHDGTEYLGDEF